MKGHTTNIHLDLMALLEDLEAHMGFELTINSGYRDPEHNLEVGGVVGSEHTYDPAQGCDVFCRRSATRYKMLKWLFLCNVKRIGIGQDFLHIGLATDKPQECVWTYYEEPPDVETTEPVHV